MPADIILTPSTSPACDTIIVSTIDETECIGTSLTKINGNFNTLKTEIQDLCSEVTTVNQALSLRDEQLASAIEALGIAPVGSIVMYNFRSGDGVTINGGGVVTDPLTITSAIDTGTDTILLSNANDGSNWQVCNGANSTPDLRGKFVVSAGTYSGSFTHQFQSTGGSPEVQLTVAQMPLHDHSASGGGSGLRDNGTLRNGTGSSKTIYEPSGSVSIGVAATGGDQPHENQPQWHALLFVQRIA